MALGLVSTGTGNADAADTDIVITGIDVSGGNEVLYVIAVQGSTIVAPTGASVTWDVAGANQPFGAVLTSVANPSRGMAIWRLIAPTPGLNKDVTITGLHASLGEVAMAVSFSGVDQVTPNGTPDIVEPGVAATSPYSSNPMTCAAGNWLVSFMCLSDLSPNFGVTGTGQVIRQSIASGSGSNNGLAFADDRDGVDDTFVWTSDNNDNVGLITFELIAAAGGPPGALPFLTTLDGRLVR